MESSPSYILSFWAGVLFPIQNKCRVCMVPCVLHNRAGQVFACTAKGSYSGIWGKGWVNPIAVLAPLSVGEKEMDFTSPRLNTTLLGVPDNQVRRVSDVSPSHCLSAGPLGAEPSKASGSSGLAIIGAQAMPAALPRVRLGEEGEDFESNMD